MGSLFDAIYRIASIPLMEINGDEATAVYRSGSQMIGGVRMIIQNREVVGIDEEGRFVKYERCTVVVPTGDCPPYYGVPNPQIKATFEFNGLEWSVWNEEGQAIRSISETWNEISLRSIRPIARGYTGLRD